MLKRVHIDLGDDADAWWAIVGPRGKYPRCVVCEQGFAMSEAHRIVGCGWCAGLVHSRCSLELPSGETVCESCWTGDD